MKLNRVLCIKSYNFLVRNFGMERQLFGSSRFTVDLKTLDANVNLVASHLRSRRGESDIDTEIDTIINLSRKKTELTNAVNEQRRQRKVDSAQIATLMRQQDTGGANELKKNVEKIKRNIAELDNSINEVDQEINKSLLAMPNLLDDRVPDGEDETSNTVEFEWGVDLRRVCDSSVAEFAWHDDIAGGLGGLDMEAATRLSGARFSVLKGSLARLERALIQYFLDYHTERGQYTEVSVPFIVNRSTLTGTGQLPKFENDLFKLQSKAQSEDFFLIPTSEVPLTSLYRGQIVSIDSFPLRLVSHSPCFRSEAGAHGRDTRGLLRQHQFHKVELVRICLPEQSDQQYDELCNDSESLLRSLGLPYRRVLLCSGDTGFGAAITRDLEVWMPSVQKYREVASCSNCWDFQAKRMDMRYKLPAGDRAEGGRSTGYPHTMNGSGLAVGRILAAILENFHCPDDGSVDIPSALQPYMGGAKKLVRPSTS